MQHNTKKKKNLLRKSEVKSSHRRIMHWHFLYVNLFFPLSTKGFLLNSLLCVSFSSIIHSLAQVIHSYCNRGERGV